MISPAVSCRLPNVAGPATELLLIPSSTARVLPPTLAKAPRRVSWAESIVWGRQ
jgi:hypothetical protein